MNIGQAPAAQRQPARRAARVVCGRSGKSIEEGRPWQGVMFNVTHSKDSHHDQE